MITRRVATMHEPRVLGYSLSIFLLLITPTIQSECVVSEWSEWSTCHGGCKDGQVVRNRDVLQPPLPEVTPGRRRVQKLCPHLYEVKYCPQLACKVAEEETNRIAMPIVKTLVEEQMNMLGFTPKVLSEMKDKNLKEKLIKDTEKLLNVEDIMQNSRLLRVVGPPTDTPNTGRKQDRSTSWRSSTFRDQPTDSKSIESTTQMASSGELLKDSVETAGNFLKKSSRRLRNYSSSRSRQNESRSIETQVHRKRIIIKDGPAEKPLKPTKKENKSEVVENITKNDTVPTTLEPITTTPPSLFWKRGNGFVPNTKEHASDITSQLYMTQSVIQSLADDPIPLHNTSVNDCWGNKRCCKVTRETCSDGSIPKFVKRWYRPEGSNQCLAYHYPKCGELEEQDELPILFGPNCQDICFKGPEKKIPPLFNIDYEYD